MCSEKTLTASKFACRFVTHFFCSIKLSEHHTSRLETLGESDSLVSSDTFVLNRCTLRIYLLGKKRHS